MRISDWSSYVFSSDLVHPLGVEYVFASLPAFVQYARIFPPANGTLIPAIVGSKDVASAVQPSRALRYATITAAVSADEPEVLNEYEAGSELAKIGRAHV